GTRIYYESVMGFIRNLHRTLLIPTVGKYIVGIASLFMVILMITGLRLWIPKHWKLIKERLSIKKGASFKRQNYDLHNSLGFYFSPFITLISMTGVAITFSNFIVLALFIVNFQSPQSIGDIIGKRSTYQASVDSQHIEEILSIAQADMPQAQIRGFQVPRDSVGAFNVNFVAEGQAVTGDHSFALYDQYTGDRLLNNENDFAKTAQSPLNWLTSIHYGTFGGMTTRILALLASLVAPILFVTGFIVWWGRWKKRNRQGADPNTPGMNVSEGTGKKKILKPIIPDKELLEV
ncbi:MAG: PepSY-associated TM helix domain-containing protein, partial [Bacteroidota bacterium]